MGTKGSTGGAASAATAQRLVEELAVLGPIEAKKMFGGHGIFRESLMFALVDPQGLAFLRSEGDARQFTEMGGQKHSGMPYWSIPHVVKDDHDELVRWASDALSVAQAHKKK